MKLSKHDFRINFVRSDFEFFERECNFNEEQLKVFRCMQKDWQTVKISMELNYSASKVNKLIRQVKNKIVRVLEKVKYGESDV